jgi:hypothetical protein
VSDHALIEAVERFKLAPEQLTSADVALIAKADPDLGKLARDKYEQARDAEARADYAKYGLDWEELKKLSEGERLGRITATAIRRALAPLEARVLELEATQAAREPVP